MAYTTSTVFSGLGVYNTLTTHMLANGWTLHDTLYETDKVFKSLGINGKQNHVIRLTIEKKDLTFTGGTGTFVAGETITGGTSGITARVVTVGAGTIGVIEVIGANNFTVGETITGSTSLATGVISGRGFTYGTFKGPNDVHNAMDWITVRAYRFWNAATNVGVGEAGQFGPNLMLGPDGNTTGSIGYARTKTAVFPPYNEPSIGQTGNCFSAWDGIRRAFGNINNGGLGANTFYSYDVANIDYQQWASLTIQETSGVPVWDRVNDRFYVYTIANTATLADQWKRWNSDTNSWEALAAPPVNYQDRPSGYAWDGKDFIYVMNMLSTTFSRYSISGNSWTTLAVAPAVSNSTNYTGYMGLYVPAGVIPAVTEDVIYFLRAYNTSTLYRYNVTSNTWASAVSLPQAKDQNGSVAWDGTRYVYFYPVGSVAYVWRLDLQNISGGWSSIASPSRSQGMQLHFMNQYVCKLRVSVGVTNDVAIVGDADSIVCVARNTISNKSYWSSFGRIDSYYSQYAQVMTVPAVVGSPSTVTVGTTTGLTVGQPITLLDPSNGTFETAAIIQILNPTQFTSASRLAYTTGSLVFVDYSNTILTGDSWLALSTFDIKGFEGDGQASHYRIKPLAAVEFTTRAGVNVRGAAQVFPYVVYNSTSGIGTFENRGTVRFIFTARSGGTLQVGDIIQDATGNQYRVFNCEFTRMTNDNRLIAIGPIN